MDSISLTSPSPPPPPPTMDRPPREAASFATQADALLRKNLAFQKRNWKTNICITVFPAVLCLLILVLQILVDRALDKDSFHCGCKCVDTNGDGKCEEVCGIQYSTEEQAFACPIPSPPAWPPLLQVPRPGSRATIGGFPMVKELPDVSCKATDSCPVTVFYTGGNRSFADGLAVNLFTSTSALGNLFTLGSSLDSSNYLDALSDLVLGTETHPRSELFIEPALTSGSSIYLVLPQCLPNTTFSFPVQVVNSTIQQVVECVQGLPLWRDAPSVINNEIFNGYVEKYEEILSAYDFLNSNGKIFNTSISYNSKYNNGNGAESLLRVPRLVNMASRAYLQFLKGSGLKMQFEYIKEMPKQGTELRLDISSILGTLFFIWIFVLPFPVMLTYLVYEKQQNLRIMMKMHGLGDGPYWMISYAYFLLFSLVYMLCFLIFGSVIGLKFFRLNDYGIQFLFCFVYMNLQIMLAFLVATNFAAVKTATVIGYMYVFGSGLLGEFLFRFFIEDTSFSRRWVIVLEIIPGFSLYRGVYELAQYSLIGNYMGTFGMQWKDLEDSENGMRDVLIIMAVEWVVLLPVMYYLDQVASLGDGIRKAALSFRRCFKPKPSLSFHVLNPLQQVSEVLVETEKPDVSQERKVVEQHLLDPRANYAIISDNLKKVYPGRDGNPEKIAVRGLSLALPRGECFGMLGPNGAGKTSFISMMIGLLKPTSGTAFVQGMDIRVHMHKIYTGIGVCPQHDLLWETLTGKEHLMFYGRLKNLKGAALAQAVEESLKSVNLFNGGVGDKLAGKYSGGMKRRLSVAISLIGDPQVVYMDEPSTGLDPASRGFLWNVLKRAKRDRAIILTTHSMEEAEVLCDRLGIFVDGSLQCIGNPKDLKARYGGSLILTVTTSPSEEEEVENLVRNLSSTANKIYHISGTQKFEMPKHEVKIADVFQAVDNAKRKFTIHAWGLSDTTLEDVFIKVAKGAKSSDDL